MAEIALLIASTQIKDFLGLTIRGKASDFVTRMHDIVTAMPTLDWATSLLALGSLALIIVVPDFFRAFPVRSSP